MKNQMCMPKTLYDLDMYETATYLALNYICDPTNSTFVVDPYIIFYTLTGRLIDYKNNKEVITNIKRAIVSLDEKKIIHIIMLDKSRYVLDGPYMKFSTVEGYVIINQDECQNIFNGYRRPYDLLKFYVFLVGTINNRKGRRYGFYSMEKMYAECWCGSKSTINSYLKKLEELGIIYIYRSKKRRADGRKMPNVYGRLCDKDDVINAGKMFEGKADIVTAIKSKKVGNLRKRYNYFLNDADKYKNMETSLQLAEECQKVNNLFKELAGDDEERYMKYKPFNMDVFKALYI